MGRDRHGLHEPESVGPWRPGGGLHPHACACRAKSSSATGPIRRPGRVGAWMRAARAGQMAGGEIRRFGDNMRQVAVTEGDKVAAEMKFGSANGYGVGDLWRGERSLGREAKALAAEYEKLYAVAQNCARRAAGTSRCLWRAHRTGLTAFLGQGGFKGFTTTFEDLHGLRQLPGLAAPTADGRMATASRARATGRLRPVRAMKVMGEGCRAGRRSWRTTPITWRRATIRCSARTCWRSAAINRGGQTQA